MTVEEELELHRRLRELEQENQELKAKAETAEVLKNAVLQTVRDTNAETAKFFKELMDAARVTAGYARRTIWYMWKPGEARDHVSTIQPSPEWVASCKEKGYRLVSFEIRIPDSAEKSLGDIISVDADARLIP